MESKIEIKKLNYKNFLIKLDELNRKCDKFGIPHISYKITSTYIEKEIYDGIVINEYEMLNISIIHEKIKLGNWTLICLIDHASASSSLIKRIDIDNLIDVSNFLKSNKCDHCQKKRIRNNTFILMNENGELKQVGSSCLKDFTGYDPAQILSINNFYMKLSEEFVDEGINKNGYTEYFDTKIWLAKTIRFLKTYPYVSKTKAMDEFKMATSLAIELSYSPKNKNEDIIPYTEDDKIEAEQIIDYWKQYPDDHTDYIYNLKILLNDTEFHIKNSGIITSCVAMYKKNTSEKKMSNNSEWIGNVGDKIESEVSFISTVSIDTHYGKLYINIMKDSNENIIVWKTSKSIPKESFIIAGTISKHEIFRNKKQTLLTRCKIK